MTRFPTLPAIGSAAACTALLLMGAIDRTVTVSEGTNVNCLLISWTVH
jgi:hypothetical protein